MRRSFPCVLGFYEKEIRAEPRQEGAPSDHMRKLALLPLLDPVGGDDRTERLLNTSAGLSGG